ncbi:MAG: hypothetical protein HQL74_05975 [Magnetococcales bacterium]|nr:hypothetical protein [Magnetococcales bacterium]
MTAPRIPLTIEDMERCWLPETAIRLVEVIGTTAALALIQEFGGVEIDIPRKVGPEHRLASLVGLEAARELVAHWGGDRLYVPKADHAVRCVRNQEMIRGYDAGLSEREIALEYRITSRHVRRILNSPSPSPGQGRPKPDLRQLALFDE